MSGLVGFQSANPLRLLEISSRRCLRGHCIRASVSAFPSATILHPYLSTSFFPLPVFLRFGLGILHSMPKAVQFVHGTPKLAASHRTCRRQNRTVRSPSIHRARRGIAICTFRAWHVCGSSKSVLNSQKPRCRGSLLVMLGRVLGRAPTYLACSGCTLPVGRTGISLCCISQCRVYRTNLLKLGWP